MRFAMRSRRGPHAPIGHNAPKARPSAVRDKPLSHRSHLRLSYSMLQSIKQINTIVFVIFVC